MKRIIATALALAVLVGCSSKTEDTKTSDAPKKSSSVSNEAKIEELITADELKSLLLDKTIGCRYKLTFSDGIEELDEGELTITEISELVFTATPIGSNPLEIPVSGSFHAVGSSGFSSGVPVYATVEPVKFNATVIVDSIIKDKKTGIQGNFEKPLVKPLHPLDLDNLAPYLKDECDGEYISSSNEVLDISRQDLRVTVVENLTPDDVLMNADYTVDIFYGDKYIATGRAFAHFDGSEPTVQVLELKKLR